MKRRRWIFSLLGIGGATATGQTSDNEDRQVLMQPFRLYSSGSRKTDLGIPSRIVAGETAFTDLMEVFVDRGDGEEPFGIDHVLEVDTVAGEALVWRSIPNPNYKPGAKDFFGYERQADLLDTSGPHVVKGDFRVRWRNRPTVA